MSGTIPTEEEFARARDEMRERDRGLSDVRARILQRFTETGLREFFILYSPNNDSFSAYFFFLDDKKKLEAIDSGLVQDMESELVAELVREGRGGHNGPDVHFEFDTHQNVEENFDGDYFSRLR